MENSSADILEFCLAKAGQVNEDSRTLLAVFILLFSLIGIITNSALFTVFIIHWKSSFGSQHFTHFVINMIISGLLYSATNLWVSVPCTFNECHFMRSDQLMIILSTPNTLAHWGYLLSALALTIYRFGIFMSKCFAYKTTWIKILLVSPWMLTAIITFGTTAMGCYKRYNRHSLGYTYNCSECNVAFGISFIDVNFYGGQAIPILMICAYIIILVCIYRGRKRGVATQRESRVDAKLALQFTVICCSQYLTAFLFFIVPKASKGAVWGVLTMNTIGVINVSVNPMVLLLFNNQVRHSIRSIVFGHRRDKHEHSQSRWTVRPITMIRQSQPTAGRKSVFGTGRAIWPKIWNTQSSQTYNNS